MGILSLLDRHKINMGTNFKNLHGKNLDLKVKDVLPQKAVPGQNRFYRCLSQNTLKIKTFSTMLTINSIKSIVLIQPDKTDGITTCCGRP